MANITRIGYGQVEPNHLSAKRTGQIYAQLPVDKTILPGTEKHKYLENGQFLKYDYANGKCDLSGAGEFMLVYNEIKLYDERHQMYRDYAMKEEDFMDGVMVPRLFKTNIGDIFTTNTLAENTDVEAGDYLYVGANGYLTEGTSSSDAPLFQVAKRYTLADGQEAVKVVRVA